MRYIDVFLIESLKKDLADMAKEYKKKGWEIEPGGKHDKWIPPHKVHFVLAPKTPSDHRSLMNHKKLLDKYETEQGAREALAMSLKRDPSQLK